VSEGFLDAALSYAELGFAVFPCEPGGKRPACEHGCNDATTDEDQIERWWTDRPDCNVGIATDGLLVVDIDGQDNPWLSSLGDRIDDLMGCPAAWTPRGGMHLYFRQPVDGTFRNTTSALADKVDTRASGGYVVAPPSNRAEGGGYRWFPDRELERLLPEPPAWLVELLKTNKSKAGERRDEPTPSEPLIEGRRNSTLTSIAGKMRRFGISGKAIDAALQATNCDRCSPPLDPREVSQIAASVAKYEPNQVAMMEVEGGELAASFDPPEPFPDELLNPGGLLEEIMQFNLAGAIREQPILALAGALSLMSVLTGRKVQDDLGTRTNLFILGVAASGSGKERARVVNKELLFLGSGQKHVGPERAASATGIVSALAIEPSLLFQFDEFGRYLRAATSRTAGAHLTEVTTTLMRLFTSAGTVFFGDAYADSKKNTAINQPHAVLYGTTVPGNLYETLTVESLSDGFMSRLLIFESETEAPDYQRRGRTEPAAELLESVRAWVDRKSGAGNLTGSNPEPQILELTPEAKEIADDLLDRCLARERDRSDPYRSVWTRCGEKARKLALIYACSRGGSEIDADAFSWGAALSEHLTRKLASVGRRWVAETPHEANCQRVYRWLAEQRSPATKRELSRAMRHLKKVERDAVLADLVELHGVRIVTELTGGRPTEVIHLQDNTILSQAVVV
jgi:hypothetical protein